MATWQLDYYNTKVAKTIDAWPLGIRASFLRIAETMRECVFRRCRPPIPVDAGP